MNATQNKARRPDGLDRLAGLSRLQIEQPRKKPVDAGLGAVSTHSVASRYTTPPCSPENWLFPGAVKVKRRVIEKSSGKGRTKKGTWGDVYLEYDWDRNDRERAKFEAARVAMEVKRQKAFEKSVLANTVPTCSLWVEA